MKYNVFCMFTRSLCFTVYKREDAFATMEVGDQSKIIHVLQGKHTVPNIS